MTLSFMRGLFCLSFYFFVLKKSILTQTHKERGNNMSIPRKTYDFPKESINVLNPSSQHTKAIENIYSKFESSLGRTLAPLEFEKIKEWVSQGVSEELILQIGIVCAIISVAFCVLRGLPVIIESKRFF